MKTTNFGDFIRKQMEDDPKLARLMREARFNGDVAQFVYDARKEKGFSKKKLAKLLGLKRGDISNIEMTNYKLTLPLLRKITEVFGVQLKFCIEALEVETKINPV